MQSTLTVNPQASAFPSCITTLPSTRSTGFYSKPETISGDTEEKSE